MGDKSGIQWTEATWNPTTGCTIVSEGCRNCYAMQQAGTRLAHIEAYKDTTRKTAKGPRWTGKINLLGNRLDQPLRWRRPRLIFVNSMSDLFHEDIPFGFIAAVFGVMAAAKQHTFQVLTKRPKRASEFFRWLDELAEANDEGDRPQSLHHFLHEYGVPHRCDHILIDDPWPLPNVWLGTSVEDQAAANSRITWLLDCPAAVRWLSCEPLLDQVDLTRIEVLRPSPPHGPCALLNALTGHVIGPDEYIPDTIDWVVVGGESGRSARACDAQWIEKIVKDCQASKAPVFVKQLGARYCDTFRGIVGHDFEVDLDDDGESEVPRRLTSKKGGNMDEWPAALRVREFPSEVR